MSKRGRISKPMLTGLLSQNSLPEDSYCQGVAVYRNLLNMPKAADSVEMILAHKFPNGIIARDKVLYQLFREPDLAKKQPASTVY